MNAVWRPARFPACFAGDYGAGTRRGVMWRSWIVRACGRSYGLIHVPSGCRVADLPTEQAARGVAETIDGLTDWRSPLPAADPEIRAALRRAIRQFTAASPALAAA